MRHALVAAQLLRQARAASVPTEARGRPARDAVAPGPALLAWSIATLLAVAALAVVLAEVW